MCIFLARKQKEKNASVESAGKEDRPIDVIQMLINKKTRNFPAVAGICMYVSYGVCKLYYIYTPNINNNYVNDKTIIYQYTPHI